MQELIRAVREVRDRYQIDPKAKLELVMTAAHARPFEPLLPFITAMAGPERRDGHRGRDEAEAVGGDRPGGLRGAGRRWPG